MSSKASLITEVNGDDKAFHERYLVGPIIGEGEFGVVKKVFDCNAVSNEEPQGVTRACKLLRKGAEFKNNTLIAAIDPAVLRRECDILRELAGKHHNCKLIEIYESPSTIYIVTEFCCGGGMMDHISAVYGPTGGLRIEDISRMSFELLDAVNHCANHHIIHRDIKPENIMFRDSLAGSSLCLIDFGSSAFDSHLPLQQNVTSSSTLEKHTTFAGSAFYTSPEMFQKNYTLKTDIWSVGVTLYVLASGYPADNLQTAFNILQSSRDADDRSNSLKTLPNIPLHLPDSYFDMLAMCLTYKQKLRNTAFEVLGSDFVKFHRDLATLEDADGHHDSQFINNSIDRHAQIVAYSKFERSVTMLLATMAKDQVSKLMNSIDKIFESDDVHTSEHSPIDMEALANKKRLQIIRMSELFEVLKELNYHDILQLIKALPGGYDYDNFAYHVASLRQLCSPNLLEQTNMKHYKYSHNALDMSISRGKKVNFKRISSKNSLNGSSNGGDKYLNEKVERRINSVHGNNIYHQLLQKRMRSSESTPCLINLAAT
jgi:calcium-dependent protein kinase